MKRRLYYLFPDSAHAQGLQHELSALALAGLSVHTVVNRHTEFNGAGDIHTLQEPDRDYFVEWLVWRINLVIFSLSLLVFVVWAVVSPSLYLALPLAVMALSFAAGLLFSLRVPNVHWDEFRHAVPHGEVLMMVDIPAAEVSKVDQHIHRLHPEAVTGGVGWAA